jgi:hypothetical protein
MKYRVQQFHLHRNDTHCSALPWAGFGLEMDSDIRASKLLKHSNIAK